MNIIAQLTDLGITAEMLDNMVCDAANDLAANANNGGLQDQIRFLLIICGWTGEAILEQAKEEKGDWLRNQEPPQDDSESFADFLIGSYIDGDQIEGLDVPEEV